MRQRSRISSRRSIREWGVRVALALVAVGAGASSVTRTLAYSERGELPEVAHRLAPGDGRIRGILSEKLSAPAATPAERIEADKLARSALRRDPTAVSAVATLGINAELRGDTAGARRIFAYSQMLSRRDLRTQLWGIEDAVRRGDVAGALKQYDIALRTSDEVSDLLYPVLTSAITDPAIRNGLVRTLTARPAWTSTFVTYVAVHGPDPRITYSLFTNLRRAGVPVPDTAKATLIGALVKDQFRDEAWAYYASIRPGSDRRRSRDPGFTAQLDSASPFDWNTMGDASIVATIQRGTFDFSAPASIGGPALRQMQLLPAGDYVLQGHSQNIDQSPDARPYWTLACQDGRELGRVDVPNSAHDRGNFSGRFSVPAGCPSQYLSLVIRASDAVSGVGGQIDRAQLAPAR